MVKLEKPNLQQKPINNKKLNEMSFNSEYARPVNERLKEKLSRFESDNNNYYELGQIIRNSDNNYQLFSEYYKIHHSYEELVALGIFDEQKAEMLLNLYNHEDIHNAVMTTDVNNIKQDLLEHNAKLFDKFLINHPEYAHYSDITEDPKIKLPHIYIIGNNEDYKQLEAMSLETKIFLISNLNELENFEKDTNKKIIILSENANMVLSDKYNEIYDKQDFKVYRKFHIDDENVDNEIIPFTRKKLINTLLS